MPVVIDWDSLTLSEFIALEDELRRQLRSRFEREVALVFTDVVGSTAFAERWGDVAGRALLDRHLTLVRQALASHDGRLVDVAGDGAFCVFFSAQAGLEALIGLMESIEADNHGRPGWERLAVRTAMHLGPVLMDDERVSGDAVNLAARLADSAEGGEIRLSEQAWEHLPPELRLRCRRLGPLRLKGAGEPIDVWRAAWREAPDRPYRVRVVETGAVQELPDQPRIAFGRLDVHEGRPANDVVLALPDAERTRRISRWHFEVVSGDRGLELRQISRGRTEIDGNVIGQGQTHPVKVGTRVVVARVLTLSFEGAGEAGEDTRMALD